jgi:hypothetical protein
MRKKTGGKALCKSTGLHVVVWCPIFKIIKKISRREAKTLRKIISKKFGILNFES